MTELVSKTRILEESNILICIFDSFLHAIIEQWIILFYIVVLTEKNLSL